MKTLTSFTLVAALSASAAASCGEPADPASGDAGAGSVARASAELGGRAPLPAAPSANGTGTSASGVGANASGGDDRVASARFGDGARAFATVREALLGGYYAEGITEDDVYRAATAGMLEKLEPRMKKWNRLLAPSEVAEMKNDLRGEVVGIGIHVSFDVASGYADVLAAFPGSPSEKAGVLPGDKIVTVDGKLYKGMRLEDVVSDIRGKAGESVKLRLLRGGDLVDLVVVRERIAYDTASHAVFSGHPGPGGGPGGLGYVRIPSFTEKTPGQVKDALAELGRRGVSALVVDLRQNPGGSFDRAVETADLFLPRGTGIVSLKKKGKPDERFLAKGSGVLLSLPLAVLVGESTGSGAELLAAALQEGRHARLVGEHTLGKWTVQSLDDLPNGYAYKYTVGLFASPSGRSFEGTGIAPDVEVSLAEKDVARANATPNPEARLAIDAQLRTAQEILVRR